MKFAKIRYIAVLTVLGVNFNFSFESVGAPLWEVGAAVGAAHFFDYPASDNSRYLVLPAPIIRYRGNIFRADEEDGARASLLKNRYYEIDLSLGGSLPANSEDNEARQGMPDLDFIGEIGPRISFNLWKVKYRHRLKLKIPFRAAFSTNFVKTEHQGYRFAPELEYEKYNFIFEGWRLGVSGGVNYTDERLQDYFYQVQPEFASIQRPQFDAKPGYLGNDVFLSILINWRKSFLFMGSGYNSFDKASNTDSPLYKKNHSYTFVIAYGMVFYESERQASDRR